MIRPFLDLKVENAPYRQEIAQAIDSVLKSGQYIGGEAVERFEHNLASATQVSHAIATSNGFDALRLTLSAMVELGKLNKGDGVIVPANSFVASALAISQCGMEPVFADVDPTTMNLSAQTILKALRPTVRAIMPVHLYGNVCWDEDILHVVQKHNLLVIEDNAQALGAKSCHSPGINGTWMAGGLGHAAAVSFYPTKNLGALGDAGAILTNDPLLASTIRKLRNYGGEDHYNNELIGYNCRMDAIQATVLDAKLKHLDEINLHRAKQAAIYNSLIINPAISKPQLPGDGSHIYYQYVIKTPKRDELKSYLQGLGIGTAVHYPLPIHKQPCYQQYSDLSLPEVERLSRQILSLPLGFGVDLEYQKFVAEKINKWATI